METPANLIESLYESAEAYGKTTYQLSKLRLLETTTVVATKVLTRLIVITVISLFILIFTVGIAQWLGEITGKSYYGYFIVAGFYFVAGTILHFFLHRWIKKPVSGYIIKQVLKQ